MNKIIISILIILTLVGTASATDSIFGTYENKFFKDDIYTLILTDPVQSEILFDDVYSYFYTTNYLYSTYKINGSINYKIKIQLSSIRLSDNYIYAVKGAKIYQINKINGTIGTVFSKNNEPKIYTDAPEQVFEVLLNNTNLAPDVPGHPPGTNERIQGTTYWANTTPIELHVFAHANATSQAVSLNLSINGSVVQQIKLRPLAIAENTYAPLTAIIPKGSNYSISIENYHHYEWREYPILSGQNGSVAINNNNYSTNYINNTYINGSQIDNSSLNLKVNKSGDSMSGNLNMTENNISSVNSINISNGINMISKVYNTTYSVNTTATSTGVVTVNVSNAVGVNNDTLVYLNGHANANFSDVFFTQNAVVIPFNHTETNSSVFYINITSLDYPVFLNYGNPSVNNIGNGNTTFDIYADGTTLEKFDTNGVTLSSGNISITANAAGGNYLTTKTKLQRPSVAVYDLTVPAFYSIEGFTNTANLQNEANANQIIFYAAGDNNFYTEYRDASSVSGANIGARTTTEHVQKLLWRNSSTDTKFYIDDIQKTSPVANFPALTDLYFTISAHDSFNVANILIDNLLIYKYSDGKFNTWGTETPNSVPIQGQIYCVFVNAAGSVQATLGAC